MKTDALDAINKLAPCRTHDEAYAFYKRFGKAPDGWEVRVSPWNLYVRRHGDQKCRDYTPWVGERIFEVQCV